MLANGSSAGQPTMTVLHASMSILVNKLHATRLGHRIAACGLSATSSTLLVNELLRAHNSTVA